jgi:signal transduction histidine kinase
VNAVPDLLASGWPLAVVMAALVVGDRARQSRRREALSRALHELRRPLQAMALAPDRAGSTANGEGVSRLELALAALADLDSELNGGPAAPRRRLVRLRPLVEGSVGRWRAAAAAAGSGIELRWAAGSALVLADPARLAQALDNLVLNAIEHGAPPFAVETARSARGVRIAVRDGGGDRGVCDPARGRSRRLAPRGHGHGMAVVASIAAEHGGRFAINRDPRGTVAVLELPIASPPLPVARAASAA